MSTIEEKQGILLGFLGLYETPSHDGYMGAILVLDSNGMPQEFRCTHPVKVSDVQKPLYGNGLQRHIGIKLCGVPLVESVKSKLELLMVCEGFLLDVRTASPCPTVLIRRARGIADIKASDSSEFKWLEETVDCSATKFHPIVFSAHLDFGNDVSPARKILEKIITNFDPLEPFERMSKAIGALCKQDKRFQ